MYGRPSVAAPGSASILLAWLPPLKTGRQDACAPRREKSDTMPYANNSGVKIYWEEQGQGDPVLLIMGLGYTLDMWYRTVPALSQHHRIITFDNRGVGRTDVPPGPYPIAAMAADAAAVMDSAGVTRAHVFGISMGGMIAQEFALQYPERTRSLILGCTSHGGPEAVLADAEVITTLMARGSMSVEEGIRSMIPFIYDASTPRERVEEDLEIRRRTFPTAEGYFAQVQGIFAWESRSRLSQLRVPTMVIHGESDRLIPPENGRRLARLIDGAKLVMIPSASHIFPTDQPDAAHQAIVDFLAARERDGAA
jgi:3-oxoadipate enol-lactonase